ncbi:hypothetical protein [Candidatus Enterococcus willemsii]|uniref:Membrane protein 6-pyruvoyl-tetrahydropterin synthase-related domain-containing protein n=1 Tax=Candidatus Enterococcus willemsii TaxID=1857215 RepID=A0ABQ6Z2J8_9ENTE|nr:hypothetical protein [Enterococcus sp. CU12B]KAF1306013.1 hypothetical protein BAU17_03345 [Enterococcus sp. CU12B]
MKTVIRNHGRYLLFIILASFVLILPQLLTKGMILGSDAVFHYNRFYDTAMQIKEFNFQHFVSMYGFQQTGRIVNALYGPLFAYIQGILILLSPSWFGYQVLSCFLIYFLSGISMYTFLQKGQIRHSLSCAGAIFYLTTFSIQYWTMRQGFSSWGAALLPLCLLPIIDMATKKDFNWLQLSILTSLMFQTHVFSSLILILIYIPFFLYAWLYSDRKSKLVLQLAQAIGLFLLLTLAIWISFYFVYSGNTIADPFINLHMDRSVITRNSIYWVFTPGFLGVLLITQLIFTPLLWKKMSTLNRLMTGSMIFFLILSTNIVPWKHLQGKDIYIVELIQFPFRFFVPVTVLLIFLSCYTYQHYVHQSTTKKLLVTLLLVASVGQTMMTTYHILQNWVDEKQMIMTGKKHLFVRTNDNQKLKAAVHTRDFSEFLQLVEKSTPDYLPIYQDNPLNKYNQYEKYVLNNPHKFKKTVKNHRLVVEWESNTTDMLDVPVINYERTELTLNGKALQKDDLRLTKIGTIQVQSKIGHNELVLTYNGSRQVLYPIIFSLISWIIALTFLIKQTYKKTKSA